MSANTTKKEIKVKISAEMQDLQKVAGIFKQIQNGGEVKLEGAEANKLAAVLKTIDGLLGDMQSKMSATGEVSEKEYAVLGKTLTGVVSQIKELGRIFTSKTISGALQSELDAIDKKYDDLQKKVSISIQKQRDLVRGWNKQADGGYTPTAKTSKNLMTKAVEQHGGSVLNPLTGKNVSSAATITAAMSQAPAKIAGTEWEAIAKVYKTYTDLVETESAEVVQKLQKEQKAYSELQKQVAVLKETRKETLSSSNERAPSYLLPMTEAIDDLKKHTSATKANVAEAKKAKIETEENKQALDEFNEALGRNGNVITKAALNFISYRVILNGFKRVVNQVKATITEMDKALTDMTVVTSLSREQAWQLVGTLQDLAKQTGMTTTQIADMTTKYLQQGKTLQDALVLTEAAAKAARIAGIDGTRSIELLTNAMNGFQMSAEQAMEVSDKFAALAAASATDYEGLAVALSKVAAQANLAGMSMDFTLGLLAKGIEVTQEAPETIGTALKTVISRMRELTDYGATLEDGVDVNRVQKALDNIGVSLMDQNGQFRDLELVLTEVGHKWDDLNRNQQANVTVALAGTRQQSRLIAMMQDFGRTEELLNISMTSAGATMAQHRKYMEGLEAASTRLTTSFQQLITTVTNSDVFIDTLDKISSGLEYVSNHTEILGAVVVGIGAVLTPIFAMQITSKLAEWGTNISKVVELIKSKIVVGKKEIKTEKEKQKASTETQVVITENIAKEQVAENQLQQGIAETGDIMVDVGNVHDKETDDYLRNTERKIAAERKLQAAQKQSAGLNVGSNTSVITASSTASLINKESSEEIVEQASKSIIKKQANRSFKIKAKVKPQASLSAPAQVVDDVLVDIAKGGKKVTKTTKNIFGKLWDDIAEWITKIFGKFFPKLFGKTLKEGAEAGFKGIFKGILKAAQSSLTWIGLIIEAVFYLLERAFSHFKDMGGSLKDYLSLIPKLLVFLGKIFDAFSDIIRIVLAVNPALGLIVEAITWIFGAVMKFLPPIIDIIFEAINFVANLINLVGGVLNYFNIFKRLSPGLQVAAEFLQELADGFRVFNEYLADTQEIGERFMNWLQDTIPWLANTIKRLTGNTEKAAERKADRQADRERRKRSREDRRMRRREERDNKTEAGRQRQLEHKQEKLYDAKVKEQNLSAISKEYQLLSSKTYKTEEDYKRLEELAGEISSLSTDENNYMNEDGSVNWTKVTAEAKQAAEDIANLTNEAFTQAQTSIQKGDYNDSIKAAYIDKAFMELEKESANYTAVQLQNAANAIESTINTMEEAEFRSFAASEDNIGELQEGVLKMIKANGEGLQEQMDAYNDAVKEIPESAKKAFNAVYAEYERVADLMGMLGQKGDAALGVMSDWGFTGVELGELYNYMLEQHKMTEDQTKQLLANAFASSDGTADSFMLALAASNDEFKKQDVINLLMDIIGSTPQDVLEDYVREYSSYDDIIEASKKYAMGELSNIDLAALQRENAEFFQDPDNVKAFFAGTLNRDDLTTKATEKALKDWQFEMQKVQGALELADTDEKRRMAQAELEYLKQQQELMKYAWLYNSQAWKDAAALTKEELEQLKLQKEIQKVQDAIAAADQLELEDAQELLMLYEKQKKQLEAFTQQSEYKVLTENGLLFQDAEGNWIEDRAAMVAAAEKGVIDSSIVAWYDTNIDLLKKASEYSENAIEGQKQVLQDYYEQEKDLLEKMSNNYSNYFDKLDALQEEQERETKRESLVKQIAALSSGFGSSTKSMQKDLLQQLSELDEEAADARKQEIRDKALKTIEDKITHIDTMIDTIVNDPNFNVDKYIDLGETTQNASGGLVNYTGLAWVDGTPSKPEAFLSADDTLLIRHMLDGLAYSPTKAMQNIDGDSNSISIGSIVIQTNNLNNNQDFKKAGSILAQEFAKVIQERGLNVNTKK